jgi:hypothetical protein
MYRRRKLNIIDWIKSLFQNPVAAQPIDGYAVFARGRCIACLPSKTAAEEFIRNQFQEVDAKMAVRFIRAGGKGRSTLDGRWKAFRSNLKIVKQETSS